MINKLFKSVLEMDKAPVVICDKDSIIVYMNPAAIKRYKKDLTGRNIKDCHDKASSEKIDMVISWFLKSPENNIVFTYQNKEENKDVYMVALREEKGEFIGYYEKHEYRNPESSQLYNME